MKQKTIWLVAILLGLGVPLAAQSAATDTISALLAEVRQLRMTLERTAVTAPQIQLLGARLTVQNDRLARAAGDHNAARRELEEVSVATSEVMTRLQNLETTKRDSGAGDSQRRQFDEMEAALKHELGSLAAREQRLRAREAELAGALSTEQSQWFELNRRLDELERALTAR